MTNTEDKLWNIIQSTIDKHFGDNPPKDIKGTNTVVKPIVLDSTYSSIEDYTTKTGKRFRMLKEQKERNLTREEAFNEFITK